MATSRRSKTPLSEPDMEEARVRTLAARFPKEDLSVLQVSLALDRADVEITRRLATRFLPFGVTPMAMQTLVSILQADDAPLSYQQLGRELRVTKANISWALKRLEQDRLIVRRADPDDRRKVRAKLTKRGAAVLDSLVILARDTLEEIFADLDAGERAQLKDLLSRAADISG